MVAAPPNVTAHRLLDGLLSEPGVAAFEDFLRWLLEASPEARGAEVPRTRRLALAAEVLQAHPRQAELLEVLRRVWTHGSTIRLLAETGLPAHITLVKEAFERAVDHLVPRLEADDDLYALLSRLNLQEEDARWVETLSAESLAPWRVLLAIPRRVLLDAARLVAVRAAAVGLSRSLLELEPGQPELASPFVRLPGELDHVIADPADEGRWQSWLELRSLCAQALARAHDQLDRRGVSTDLIYQLELLETQFERLDGLVSTATGRDDGVALAAALIRGAVRQRGVRSLARSSLKRLARKVTEHTAETGEHYQVRDAHEWEAAARSAAGGGVITAFTALGKYVIGSLPLPPAVAGLAYSANYSASFIAMQLGHLTLASKQPAMTGAALAAALGQRGDFDAEVGLVAGITRSQMAVTIGNVFSTAIVSVAIVALSQWLLGAPLLAPETAIDSVASVHPLASLTIPFAVLTGVMLWLSSLAAGWAANWSAYRGLPEALATHRGLKAALGTGGAAWLGRQVALHLSGIVGYLALGFLLGFVPVLFSKFLGLPVEVRHVTLQAASLVLAVGSLYGTAAFHWQEVAWGGLGILVIAACNIGVSFALALRTALRARDLGSAERSRLWAALRQAFRAEPRRFLWRPRR
jgi:site-specific recombinase